ncbi:MAG: tetratricopeptide repeat protein [Pseudomonadota bacterium]|nr:tetratricopeptide repeat protein [Pseudomonadota bacterium]
MSLKNQGNEAYKQRQYHDALKYYEQGLHLKPDEPTLSLNKGLMHFTLRQFDETVKACRTALQFDPQYFKARFYLAKACCELALYDDALIEINHCLAQKPGDKDCLQLKDQCSSAQHVPK